MDDEIDAGANSVTSIRNYAFSGCSSLARAGPPFPCEVVCALLGCGEHVAAQGSVSSMAAVMRAEHLRRRIGLCLRSPVGTLRLTEGLQEISEGAFKDCTSLRAVRVISTISIGHGAFEGCSGLPATVLVALEERYEEEQEQDSIW